MKTLITFTTVLLLTADKIWSQKTNIWQDIDDTASFLMSTLNVPGLSLSIIQNGTVQKNQGYGFRNLEQKKNVTKDTLFNIASIAKSFTATLAVCIFKEHNLSLDEPLANILRNVNVPVYLSDRYRSEKVSMRDLLSHRTCIEESILVLLTGTSDSREEYVRKIRFLPEVCPFRTRFVYSDAMYTLAGWVLEQITGQTWEQLIKTYVFANLNMTSSMMINEMVSKFEKLDAAIPYYSNGISLLPVDVKIMNRLPATFPAGGIVSSSSDMIKWMKFLLENRQGTEDSLIVPQLFEPAIVYNMNYFSDPSFLEFYYGYSLGFWTGITNNYARYMHIGYWTRQYSQLSLFPELQLGIYTAVNGPDFMNSSIVNKYLHNVIFNLLTKKTDLPVKDIITKLKENIKELTFSVNTTAPVLNNSFPIVQKNYIGQYGNFSYGNVSVVKGLKGTLYIEAGWMEAQLLPTNYSDTFLLDFSNSSLKSEAPNFVMATFSGLNENGTRTYLDLFAEFFNLRLERNLLMSDAPLKLWNETDC